MFAEESVISLLPPIIKSQLPLPPNLHATLDVTTEMVVDRCGDISGTDREDQVGEAGILKLWCHLRTMLVQPEHYPHGFQHDAPT